MRDHYDFSNGRKNPYAASIKKNGYSVRIHKKDGSIEEFKVSPEEVAQMSAKRDKALEEYRSAHALIDG